MRPRDADGGLERTLGDQALTYMARRYRGNLKGHLLTHLHARASSGTFCAVRASNGTWAAKSRRPPCGEP